MLHAFQSDNSQTEMQNADCLFWCCNSVQQIF